MFYLNEVDLSGVTEVDEMVRLMKESGVTRVHQIAEVMASDNDKIPSVRKIDTFKDVYTIQVEGKDYKVISECNYVRSICIPCMLENKVTVLMQGFVIRRANKKRGIESLRLSKQLLEANADYMNIVKENKSRAERINLVNIAHQVLDLRELDVIDETKLREYSLNIAYDKTPKEDRFQFLKDNGFTGLENLGVYTSQDDGYGHTCGRCTNIDFRTRSVYVIGYSSDD